jgi:hypothetical protein
MTSLKTPLRWSVLAGASVLALGLAAPVMANDLKSSSGSTVNVPQSPDVGVGYRPDPNRKTVGEMEREIAQGSTQGGTSAPQRAGDMNKVGESSSGQPIRQGTAVPSGPGRPMGDATSPGSGNWNQTGTSASGSGMSGSSGSMSGQGMSSGSAGTAGNLQIERVRIEDLPPSLQQAVRSRMDRQQTPSELVETTILNRLALMGSDYKLNSARKEGSNYVLFVTNPNGQQATMLYETNSGNLREVQM